MLTIENQSLKIAISPTGAELQSIFSKDTKLEYIWNADPGYWAKKSPILFPIVGTLKHDRFFYRNKSYKLSRHGFAREQEFTVQNQTKESIDFVLESNSDTLKKFPFEFELKVAYSVLNSELRVSYYVLNKNNGDMYFSIGAHPAFKVPLVEGTNYNDYYLEFDKHEPLIRWPISKDGLIEREPVAVSQHGKTLPLSKELFLDDALVFKNLTSSSVALRSSKTPHGLDFRFPGFPFLGIWAAKNADFVCIEPWCGIADSVDANQQLTDKEGINKLAPGNVFERTWTAEFF